MQSPLVKAWAESCFHKSWLGLVTRKDDSSKGIVAPGRKTKEHALRRECLPGTEGTLHVERVLRQVTQGGPPFGGKTCQNKQKRQTWISSCVLLFLLNEKNTWLKVTLSIWRHTKMGHLGKINVKQAWWHLLSCGSHGVCVGQINSPLRSTQVDGASLLRMEQRPCWW